MVIVGPMDKPTAFGHCPGGLIVWPGQAFLVGKCTGNVKAKRAQVKKLHKVAMVNSG